MSFSQLLLYGDWGLLALRLAVAAIFLFHAFPKLKMSGELGKMMGWPSGAVMLLGLVELASAILVATGIYLQLGALLLGVIMLGAIYHKIFKWKIPFWSMNNTGWEFDLILLAANVALLLEGGGIFMIAV